MTLRTRLRQAFTRSRSSGSSDSNQSSSKESRLKDPNVYQPGEKMPPMKYRRPVDKAHKQHLEAFSFAQSWRRKSDQSIYSPMGSRMPSRRNSVSSFRRAKKGTKDIGVDSGVGSSIGDKDDFAAGDRQIQEGSDEEGDVTNVGLSRRPTRDSEKSEPVSPISGIRRSHSVTSSGFSPTRAFAPEDLELALKRSRITPPEHSIEVPA